MLYKFCPITIHNYHTLSIYKFGLSVCLSVCMFVCLFVSNKRQNGWTERAQIFFGSLVWFQGRFMDDQIFKNFPLRKFDFWKFWKSPKFILFLFYNVYNENMFTIDKEDGHSLVFIFITKYTLQKFSFFLSNILFKYFLFR